MLGTVFVVPSDNPSGITSTPLQTSAQSEPILLNVVAHVKRYGLAKIAGHKCTGLTLRRNRTIEPRRRVLRS